MIQARWLRSAIGIVVLFAAVAVLCHYFVARPSVNANVPIATRATPTNGVLPVTGEQYRETLKMREQAVDAERKPSYRESLGAPDIAREIKRLGASADPNDWYKAAALNIKCSSVFDDKGEVEKGVWALLKSWGMPTFDQQTALEVLRPDMSTYMQVLARIRQQCGEAAQSIVPILPDMMARARAHGSPLALAPISSWKNYQDGLVTEQQEQVRAVLADPEGRTAWLALNSLRITLAIEKNEVFPGASSGEINAAFFFGLCYLGDDCSARSLHVLDICGGTQNCGAGTVEESITASIPPARLPFVIAAANSIALGVQSGDLASIGLLKAKTPK